jgi:hypothetical protein
MRDSRVLAGDCNGVKVRRQFLEGAMSAVCSDSGSYELQSFFSPEHLKMALLAVLEHSRDRDLI